MASRQELSRRMAKRDAGKRQTLSTYLEVNMRHCVFPLSVTLLLGAFGSASAAYAADDPSASSTTSTPAPGTKVDGDKQVDAAIDSALGDHVRYRTVFDALKKGVSANDAAGVAELVRYPIVVEVSGKDVKLKNANQFVSQYNDFMTPEIRKAIVSTSYADVLVNDKGMMLGNGQAWINGICRDAKCKTYDVKVVTLQHGPG